MKKLNEEKEYALSELVIFKNNQFIVFNKPNGLEVQQGKSAEKSLKNLAEIYTKSRVYIVHRLDRPASGLVIMAKSSKSQGTLSQQWIDRTIKKSYLAIVKNPPPEEAGILKHWLKKVQNLNKSFVVPSDDPAAKEAILEYKLIGKSDTYNFLEIKLITGRHHQIRAQLAAIGCPIKGDVKYGFRRGNKDKSIHLHAWKLELKHPVSNESLTFVAPPPNEVLWNVLKNSLSQ